MLQVFVYDTQRGVREGEELDKILAFFPSSASAEQQQASRLSVPPCAAVSPSVLLAGRCWAG